MANLFWCWIVTSLLHGLFRCIGYRAGPSSKTIGSHGSSARDSSVGGAEAPHNGSLNVVSLKFPAVFCKIYLMIAGVAGEVLGCFGACATLAG